MNGNLKEQLATLMTLVVIIVILVITITITSQTANAAELTPIEKQKKRVEQQDKIEALAGKDMSLEEVLGKEFMAYARATDERKHSCMQMKEDKRVLVAFLLSDEPITKAKRNRYNNALVTIKKTIKNKCEGK